MRKKLTTEEFIERAKIIHGERYDYSESEYIGCRDNIKIICKIHGEFYQNTHNHISGANCKKCSLIVKANKLTLTNDEFIYKAKKIHKNKYDYSKTFYNNVKNHIIITCFKHGDFKQLPGSHLFGSGCPECAGVLRLTTDSFIEKSILIHGNKYDYEYVDCKNSYTPVKIKCKIHGIFEQIPTVHFKGSGCKKCGSLISSEKNKIKINDFIKRSNETHNFKYDYSKVDLVNTKTKVKIICKKHGEFLQRPYLHMFGNGCPTCSSSKGEKKLSLILKSKNINYIPYNVFSDCKNKKQLSFYFYISSKNCCIEFHGKQHFKCDNYFGGIKQFEKQKINDKIKEEYCKNKNISIIIVFEEKENSKIYKFIDLYSNTDKIIINLLLQNNIKQIFKRQYNKFKNSFNLK